MSLQVAGYTLPNTSSFTISSSPVSIEEAVRQADRQGTFLTELLNMLEPHHIQTNQTAKDAYEECLRLREWMSDQLWAANENENITSLQASMESLTNICTRFEMIKIASEESDCL
ncbi:hypothetical protein BX666DRAFT_1963095 [Dichotomocladium elegans]|nr:hypothetical protein BX666DRAFT_1963095 [Dichotomocladium elegans]